MDDHASDRRQEMPQRKPVPKAAPTTPRPSIQRWDPAPHAFGAVALLGAAAYQWPRRWLLSGAPLLLFFLLLGDSHGQRVLPGVPLWSIFTTLNLAYALSATSWLFYWVFAAICYPAILITCIFQFDYAADQARRAFRLALRDLHFINDKIAFFNLPALEIDTDVNGLFLIRGLTFSLSTLTAVAHGVEVGIKLSEDIELAIQTETVTVHLFRRIEIDNVYANIKGGDWEMTFGTLAANGHESDADAFVVSDTPILRTASMAANGTVPEPQRTHVGMTGDTLPKDTSDTESLLAPVTSLSPNEGMSLSPTEDTASQQYKEIIEHISKTCTTNIAREQLKSAAEEEEGSTLDYGNTNDLRAAICAHIHDQPSIPHPPSKSIRLSTLKRTSYPGVKRFLHRLPLLYRLLLSPIAYFHPIKIESVTAAGSGKWFVHLMKLYFFKHYSTQDQDVQRLEDRISAWLADANFAVEMVDVTATAQVPINTMYDIENHFKIKDIIAYRALPMAAELKQVVRLGGADATIALPAYLLPHHEHIMPSKPTAEDLEHLEQEILDMEGAPQQLHARNALDQLRKDEANMTISAHAHLPARFHQDLLNFIAALVKATKVIETDRDFEEIRSLREFKRVSTNMSDSDISVRSDSPVDSESKGFKTFLKKVDTGFKELGPSMREGMRKAGLNTASAMANDRWIAKLVGKILLKLERAQGDLGYSGKVPISLQEYREKAETDSKILP